MQFPPRTLALPLVMCVAMLVPSLATAQGPLTNGDNHSGSISIAGEIDVWTFSANQNDAITLSIGEVLPPGPDPGYVPWIRLQDPNGALVGTDSGALAAQVNVTAPLSGLYTVLIGSNDIGNNNTGSYLLTLAQTPGSFVVPTGDQGGPITNGENHAGEIHLGDLDMWTFAAAKDDAITVSIGEVFPSEVDPGFVPWIRLRGPTGALLATDSGALAGQVTITAPLTGTYTVLVGTNDIGADAQGSYRLTLAKTPGTFVVPVGDEGGAITNGANHLGKIHLGDLDMWTFPAAKDDVISLSIGEIFENEVDPGFVPWIRLRDPTGAQVGNDSGALVGQINVTAPLTGTYTVVVGTNDIGADAQGSYQLTLAKTPGTFIVPPGDQGGPMTNGIPHPGEIHLGDLDQWTFNANFGAAITVTISEVLVGETDPGFVPWIRLRRPDGVQVGVSSGALSAQINVPAAPLSGVYTVVVGTNDIGNDATGFYELTSIVTGGIAAPTTVNDSYSTAFNTPLVIGAPGVLSNDNTNGGGAMTAVLVTGVTSGSLTLNANGSLTYTPTATFVGPASFTYRAVNSAGPGNVATVTITVNAPPAPTTVNDSFATAVNTPLTIPAPGVLANDNSNGGGAMTAALIAGPSNGALTLGTDGSFTYTPSPGFSGGDSFTYRAVNAGGPGNNATVTISVSGAILPPLDLHASSIVGNLITLRWKPPTGATPSDYELEGGISPGETLARIPMGTTIPIFTFTAPNGAFYLRVHAVSPAGRSAASNEIRVFVNVPTPPSPPANLIGSANGSALNLAWRNTFEGGSPTTMILDVSGGATTSVPIGLSDSFAFNGVPDGTYTFAVRAENAAGSSAASNPVTLTFPGTCAVPSVPENFLAYRIGNTIHLQWDSPAGGAAPSGYILNVSGAFTLSLPVPARSLSGTVGAGTYIFSVAGISPCGPGPATAVQTVVVP
jgi:Bacterial Ig domain